MIDFDVLQGAGRWENRLIGWASSADYVQGTTLAFRSKEDAIYFAEKQGWPYKVDEPKKIEIPPKSYGECPLFLILFLFFLGDGSGLGVREEWFGLIDDGLANNYVHVPGKLRIHHTK